MFKKGKNEKVIGYNIFGLDEEREKGYIYETFKDIMSGVSFLYWWLVSGNRKLLRGLYKMYFMSCNCAVSRKEIQLVIRRHKSLQQIKKCRENVIEYRGSMEPEKKKLHLDNRAEKYKTMGTSGKEKMRYKSMSADAKKGI